VCPAVPQAHGPWPNTIKCHPPTLVALQNILIRIYFIETDRVSHFYKCRNLLVHSMTFALARYTENMALSGSRGRLVRVSWTCSIGLFGGRTSELSVCLMDNCLFIMFLYMDIVHDSWNVELFDHMLEL